MFPLFSPCLPSDSSQKSRSHPSFFSSLYLPFPVCQQALCVLSPQYMDFSTSLSDTTTTFQILLCSPLPYCSSPLTGLPTSPLEFLQTGWEEGSKNNSVLTIHKKKNNTPTEKWAKAISSSQKRKYECFKACEKCSTSLNRRN